MSEGSPNSEHNLAHPDDAPISATPPIYARCTRTADDGSTPERVEIKFVDERAKEEFFKAIERFHQDCPSPSATPSEQ